jgi:hypothetical protein
LLKRVLKEPLLHFGVLALIILAAYGLFNRDGAHAPDRIVISAPRIEQMAANFAKAWQRAPTAEELTGLIDDYVKEEIYYREALTLGLDKDDTVIRRRLRQKMEFLNDAAVDELTPTDADLESHLKAHPADFEIEPMLAVQQVFFNSERRGDQVGQDAASTLEILQTRPDADAAALGDATALPAKLPLTAKSIIAQTFGSEFADAADKASPGLWTGPVATDFGLHLIRVLERNSGRVPTLAEVRDSVARDWTNAKRREFEDRRFEDLLKRYEVTIEAPAAQGSGS